MRNIILLFIFVPCLALAQTIVTMSESEWQAIKYQLDSLHHVTDSLRQTNESLSRIIAEKDSIISQLETVIQDKEEQSEIEPQAYLEKAQIENEAFKRYLMYADSCVLRYANAQLYFKYSPKRINIALYAIDRMKNKDIKETAIFKKLLNEYKDYFEEIKTIVTEAQNDKNREYQPSYRQKPSFITSFKTKLEKTTYYHTYYKKGGITIPYLDTILDKINNELANASKNHKFCDFSSILKELQ